MTKYIKKEKYRDITHILKDKAGRSFTISNNEITCDDLYNRHKFMFDIVEEEIMIFGGEGKPKGNGTRVETLPELPEEFEKMIDEVKETLVEEPLKDFKADLLLELSECQSIEMIHKLAEEYDIDLDLRLKKFSKVVDNFKEELDKKEY